MKKDLLSKLKSVKLTEDGDPVDLSAIPEISDVLAEAIRKSGQVEKDKLYATQNSLKENIQKLTADLEAAKAIANAVPATTAPSTTPKPTTTPPTTVPPTTPQAAAPTTAAPGSTDAAVAEMLSNAFNNVVPGLIQKHLQPVLDKVSSLESESLSQYQERKTSELTAQGTLFIPELVSGKTKEEIDNSIANAIEVAKRYASPTAPNPTPNPTPASPTPATPPTTTPTQAVPPKPATTPPATPTPPPATPTPSSEPKSFPNVKEMSDADYAKQRERLMEGLKTVVPK